VLRFSRPDSTREARTRQAPRASATPRTRLLVASTLLTLAAASGCALPNTVAPQRYERGLVVVLPGVDGRSHWSDRLIRGLDKGGVTSAIEFYDWTTGVPGTFLVNLAYLERNMEVAQKLARRISDYQREHPGRPVQLVGHSGGGAITILTLEALAPGQSIDMAVLLAPAISNNYDLSTALTRTRYGICNFCSEEDVILLKVGTSLFGTVDRQRCKAAGAVGFEPPDDLKEADRAAYDVQLRQVRWTPALREYGASGTHLGWTSQRFAREYLASMLVATEARRPIPEDEG
jgi:pimeloyl-ACP methyl ester carboxylesterase